MSDLVERLRGPKNRTTPTSVGNGVMVSLMGAYHHDDALHEEAAAEILRLRSELADAKRAGWIAGRDAAAEHVCGYCVRQNSVCADHIRNMEPPA